jgi:hypothetical protein
MAPPKTLKAHPTPWRLVASWSLRKDRVQVGSSRFAEADCVLEIRSRICYRTIVGWWTLVCFITIKRLLRSRGSGVFVSFGSRCSSPVSFSVAVQFSPLFYSLCRTPAKMEDTKNIRFTKVIKFLVSMACE